MGYNWSSIDEITNLLPFVSVFFFFWWKCNFELKSDPDDVVNERIGISFCLLYSCLIDVYDLNGRFFRINQCSSFVGN